MLIKKNSSIKICVDHYNFFHKISGNLSLNPSEKERAILIKTGEGDSMILVGKWTGFVRGVPGIKGNIFKNICP